MVELLLGDTDGVKGVQRSFTSLLCSTLGLDLNDHTWGLEMDDLEWGLEMNDLNKS